MSQYINGINYASKQCTDCGLPFAVTADFCRHQKETGGSVYCPLGHKQNWTPMKNLTLATKMRAVRQSRGMTQVELGNELGVSGSSISAYETKRMKSDASKKLLDEWVKEQQ